MVRSPLDWYTSATWAVHAKAACWPYYLAECFDFEFVYVRPKNVVENIFDRRRNQTAEAAI